MSTSRQFNQALDELGNHPAADRATLNMVAGVINQHAGQRITVAPGANKRQRQQQAAALDSAGGGRSDPRQMAQRLGVSESTARRYLKGFKK